MTCPHPATTEALDYGTAVRCLACGHRVWDIRRGQRVIPRQTRFAPSRWLTEHWRQRQARRAT